MHAKRNDKDVPRNSRSPKNGKPSRSVVVRNKVKTVILSRLLENDRSKDQSEDISLHAWSKKVGLEYCANVTYELKLLSPECACSSGST